MSQIIIMKKWKCKECGKEEDIEHHKEHEVKKHKEDKAKCSTCNKSFDAPSCCNKKMYIAS